MLLGPDLPGLLCKFDVRLTTVATLGSWCVRALSLQVVTSTHLPPFSTMYMPATVAGVERLAMARHVAIISSEA